MIYDGRVIGACSLCHGAVRLPSVWHGLHLPTPTCERCGAVQASSLPIIHMRKPECTFPKHYPTGTHQKVIDYGL